MGLGMGMVSPEANLLPHAGLLHGHVAVPRQRLSFRARRFEAGNSRARVRLVKVV